jgi:16S rRNA (cytosine967-C5)-methyltransferase
MEPEENRLLIGAFLDRHPQFAPENAALFVSRDLVTEEGYVETFPHRHGMDGSFAARLVRRPD